MGELKAEREIVWESGAVLLRPILHQARKPMILRKPFFLRQTTITHFCRKFKNIRTPHSPIRPRFVQRTQSLAIGIEENV
jgi:hypothetical protein